MTGYEDYTPAPSADGLAKLSQLAVDLNAAELEAARIGEELKRANERVKDLAERDIPELMDSLGMAEFRTTAGFKIKVTKTIRASIPEAQRDAAMAWLDDNGHGGLIKRSIVVSFDRGDIEKAKKLQEQLEKKFENVRSDTKVEPSTLRAFIGEQLEKGENIPLPLFGAWEQRIAKISTK